MQKTLTIPRGITVCRLCCIDAGEKGGRVSGGQKQRIAIARALIGRPKILILDNATSDLDTENEYQVWKSSVSYFCSLFYSPFIHEAPSHDCTSQVHQALLNHARDCSILLISNKMSVVEKADHIIVLNEGMVNEEGSHDELLRKEGLYTELVRKHNMGFQGNGVRWCIGAVAALKPEKWSYWTNAG